MSDERHDNPQSEPRAPQHPAALAHAEALARLDRQLSEGKLTSTVDEVLQDLGRLDDLQYAERRRRIAKLTSLRTGALDRFQAERRKALLLPGLKGQESGDALEAMHVDSVRSQVEGLLDERATEGKKKLAEQIIWDYIGQTCDIFCCGGIGYLLPTADGLPIAVTRDGQDFSELLVRLGVHPGSPMRDRIGKFIGTRCYHDGVQTEARLSFHYDAESQVAYFAERCGQLVRITVQDIDRVPNGTNGQLFLFPKNYQPWLLNLDELPQPTDICPDSAALLPRLLFEMLEFENESLCREDLHVLLGCYIVTLFMPGIISGKILLEVLGGTGSGKTLFLRMLGRLVYGRHFEVTGMDTNESQVENAIVNNCFLVFDDVKRTSSPAILGMIRRACTGGSCKRRELYSTFNEVEEPYRAAIAITGSDEPFTGSDEMNNRALVIRAKQRDDFIDEVELLRRVDENRDALLGEMMVRLRSVIIAIRAQQNFKPNVKMRMASFATLLLRVGRQWDWGQAAQHVLDAWQEEQSGAGLDAAITEILDAWLPTVNGKTEKMSAGVLCQRLNDFALANRLSTPRWFGDSRWLTRVLRSAAQAYHRHYGFCFSGRTSGHKAPQYWFEPSEEMLKKCQKPSQQQRMPF